MSKKSLRMDENYEVLTRPELGLLLYAISGLELDQYRHSYCVMAPFGR